MNIIKNSIFFFLFLASNTPLYSVGKLSEMFEMGYLSAPYHTSLDVGLRYSNPPTTLHIEISNDPNLVHDGNAPHIGHSFSDETMLHGYIADTFMNLILEKIKFVVSEPTPPQSPPQASNPVASMDALDHSVYVGRKRSSAEAELIDKTTSEEDEIELSAVKHIATPAPEIDPLETNHVHSAPLDPVTSETSEEDEEDIKPPAQEVNLTPTLGLLLNIVSKTSSHFTIPFASGKDGDLNRGLMTLAFTSVPDAIPSKEWIQYPGKMLSGQMVANIIESTLLSKIKRTVDSQAVQHKGIYG